MTTQTEALKPCPFCGGEAELIVDSDHHGEFFQLGCKDKECLGHWAYYTESIAETPVSEAIAHWNTRALAQPEHEPVAWMHPSGGILRRLSTGLERENYTIPLYTIPPQPAQPAVAEQHEQSTTCGEPDLGGVDVFYPKDEHYKTVIKGVQRLFDDKRQLASDAIQKEIDAYKAANPHCDVVAIVGDLAPYRRRTIGLPDSAPLYTTPPTQQSCSQRQCNVKPLTDAQINVIWDSLIARPDYSREMIVRAIEAAHGIKE